MQRYAAHGGRQLPNLVSRGKFDVFFDKKKNTSLDCSSHDEREFTCPTSMALVLFHKCANEGNRQVILDAT